MLSELRSAKGGSASLSQYKVDCLLTDISRLLLLLKSKKFATPNDNSDNPKVIKKYDQNNNLIAEISPRGLETRYIYDELGRRVETIIPDTTPNNWDDNPRIKTGYSAAGRTLFQTDIFGNKEEYFYNNIGQLIRILNIINSRVTLRQRSASIFCLFEVFYI